jgi:hypothetical protein
MIYRHSTGDHSVKLNKELFNQWKADIDQMALPDEEGRL